MRRPIRRGDNGARPGRGIRGLTIALVASVAVLLAACGSEPIPSFDPTTPCNGADRQAMPGGYPELEARIPLKLAGADANNHKSGRFCAKSTLGTLWDAGFHEVQYAGAIFALGDKNGGVQLSAFRAPGLTAKLVADQNKAGAQADSKAQIVSASSETIEGRNGFRINVLNGESHLAVIVWPSADGSVIQVVAAADVDESVVQEAIRTFG